VFDRIEKERGLRVVIAAHPRTAYGAAEDMFGDREIISGSTAELIATSRLIMAHTSTAIGFAVLFREPTMLLVTRDLYDRQVYEKYTYEGFSHALDTPLQFFDEPSSLEFQKPLEVNETCYEHYVNDYLRCRGAPDQPMWDTIWEAIGKHLNPEDSTNRVPPGGMPTISLQNAAFSMTHRQ